MFYKNIGAVAFLAVLCVGLNSCGVSENDPLTPAASNKFGDIQRAEQKNRQRAAAGKGPGSISEGFRDSSLNVRCSEEKPNPRLTSERATGVELIRRLRAGSRRFSPHVISPSLCLLRVDNVAVQSN